MMQRSAILKIAAIRLRILLLVFSVFVLLRGHNDPGGGFIAGLLAGSGFILYGMAFGPEQTGRLRLMRPFLWLGTGFLLALVSAVIPFMTQGESFMQAVWVVIAVGSWSLKLGTPLLFDVGVYFAVAGMLMLVAGTIMREEVETW
jgi:multisubunit Na+/H+ antiporter MnhB subunit